MSEPVDVHVGQQIRMQRIASRMTQAELAKTIGVSLQQVQKYESARNRVSASMLCRIANCLNVSPAAFFADITEKEDAPEPTSHNARIAYLASDEGGRLVDDLLLLSPRVRGRVAALISALIREQDLEATADDLEPDQGSIV